MKWKNRTIIVQGNFPVIVFTYFVLNMLEYTSETLTIKWKDKIKL